MKTLVILIACNLHYFSTYIDWNYETSNNRYFLALGTILLTLVIIAVASNEEICELEKEAGHCKALMHRFFYNSKTEQCEEFNYGGKISKENIWITIRHINIWNELN